MLYTFSMKVLIPHKDIIFSLSKIQQEFIFDFNNFSDEHLKNTQTRLIPLFPFWAFFDDFADEKKFNFKNLRKSQIEKIDFENNKFYFSIKLDFCNSEDFEKFDKFKNSEHYDFSRTLKIYFAQNILKTEIQDFSLQKFYLEKFNKDFFPINMNVFKIGNVNEENFLWEVFDEKWIKICTRKQKIKP